LGEGYHPELIGTGHGLHIPVAVAAVDDAMESLPGQEVHELSKQRLAEVHERFRVS
jgi:hypothetical protein